MIVAGFDERYGWKGQINPGVQIAAFILLALSYALFGWAMVSNKFFATTVRIQKERGHTEQTGGPYRFVRHPGYAGLLLVRLVMRGLYRVTGNPMYVGVLAVTLGWAAFYATPYLVAYAAVVWTMFQSFIVFYEEPHLRATFGEEYDRYCGRVGRWLPHPRGTDA